MTPLLTALVLAAFSAEVGVRHAPCDPCDGPVGPSFGSSAEPEWERTPATYPGAFARPPVEHWRTALPGKPMVAAAHTERARPILRGGSLFVGSAAGEALYELDRRDGVLVRSFPASSSVESEAVVTDELVIFADTAGVTYCYDRAGSLRWKHESKAPVLVRPTLHHNRVFIATVDDLVTALDATTGALAWRYQQRPDISRQGELALYAAPPVVPYGDDVLVGFSDGSVLALTADDGDPQWAARIGEGRYPDIVAAPLALTDGIVLFSGYFEPVIALDTATRRSLWSAPHGAAAAPTLIGQGDAAVLLHPGTDGDLRAFQARSGALLWSWTSGTDGALTSPLATEAGVVIASSTGTVYLIDPADGREIWAYEPPFILEGVSATPSVDGRQLVFVTNAGNLYSFLAPGSGSVWQGTPGWTMRRRIHEEAPADNTRKGRAVRRPTSTPGSAPVEVPFDDETTTGGSGF